MTEPHYQDVDVRAIFLPPRQLKEYGANETRRKNIIRQAGRSKMRYEHGESRNIGHWTAAREIMTKDGPALQADGIIDSLVKTPKKHHDSQANLIKAVKSGQLNTCSVGMDLLSYLSGKKAECVFEISLVHRPKFEGATLTEVRASGNASNAERIYGNVEVGIGTSPAESFLSSLSRFATAMADNTTDMPKDVPVPEEKKEAEASPKFDAHGNVVPDNSAETKNLAAIGLDPSVMSGLSADQQQAILATFKKREEAASAKLNELSSERDAAVRREQADNEEYAKEMEPKGVAVVDALKKIGQEDETLHKIVKAMAGSRDPAHKTMFRAFQSQTNAINSLSAEVTAHKASIKKMEKENETQLRNIAAFAAQRGVQLPTAAELAAAGANTPVADSVKRQKLESPVVDAIRASDNPMLAKFSEGFMAQNFQKANTAYGVSGMDDTSMSLLNAAGLNKLL